MGDGVGALALGDLHQELRDERPSQRGRQRIRALIDGVGLERRPAEVFDESTSRIDHVRAAGARADRAISDAIPQRTATDINGERHDLDSERLSQPRHRDRCVQTARVGENDLSQRVNSSGRHRAGPGTA